MYLFWARLTALQYRVAIGRGFSGLFIHYMDIDIYLWITSSSRKIFDPPTPPPPRSWTRYVASANKNTGFIRLVSTGNRC